MRASHLCSLKPLPGWLATVGAGENGGGVGGGCGNGEGRMLSKQGKGKLPLSPAGVKIRGNAIFS